MQGEYDAYGATPPITDLEVHVRHVIINNNDRLEDRMN